jgi:hypothetical protein
MILPGNSANTLPKVIYEEMKGTISMKGRSISPEVKRYFDDFIPYFEEQIKSKPMNLKIDLDFEYFNTVTSRILLNFFKIAKTVEEEKFKVNIDWYVEEGDDDMADAAYDYQEMTGLKINIIEKPEENKKSK